jgi:hypothetical protein
MTLSKETVLSLEIREVHGGATIPCYPPTYGDSCYARLCPVVNTRDNCA